MSDVLQFPRKLAHLPVVDGLPVPWVTAWSAECEFSIEVCPHVHRPAVFVRQALGQGRPVWKAQSPVRVREAVFRDLCAVCGGAMTRRYGLSSGGWSDFGGFKRYVLRYPALCYTCIRWVLEHGPAGLLVDHAIELRATERVFPVLTREEIALGFPGLEPYVPEVGVVGMAYLVVASGEWSAREAFLARGAREG